MSPTSTGFSDRSRVIDALRGRPDVSVLVVGGGINGLGTFRDLALNGVDVLLVERGDFCSGASSASSHMAHGGIRYLENGEFRLVREAVRERNYLIERAPHIVRPLPTTIPIFRIWSGLFNAPLKFLGVLDRPAERGSAVIKLGLVLYDAYTGRNRTVPRHRFLNRSESLARWERLNPSIVHTATYYDGVILQPERLGLELALEAEQENANAVALNYAKLTGAQGEAVCVRDELSGQLLQVKPRIVVNATGPWIDLGNAALGTATHFIGGTKGSHIVLDHRDLRDAIGDHEFFFENNDGRIVLILPLYDKVVVGTTDVAVDDPDSAICTEEEVDYFLDVVRRIFPSIEVQRSHIVFQYCGVRPLAASQEKRAGQITRDHEIRVVDEGESGRPFPILSLVGGKWTSWRAFSQEATDKCLALLERSRAVDTSALSIGGGRGYPLTNASRQELLVQISERASVGAERAESLFSRYGTRALQVADFLALEPDGALESLPDYTRREIAFIVQSERALRLDDILLRRTMLAMLGRVTRAAAEEITSVMAKALGWDESRSRDEIERAGQILKERHGVAL